MIYIYALKCPMSGEIRYIGKTTNLGSRLRSHVSSAVAGEKTWRAGWVRSLLSRGLRPVISVVLELPVDADWQTVERAEIARHRALGYKLTNLTLGGLGLDGLDPQRRARSVAKAAKKLRANWSDPSYRVRMLESMRTEDARAKRASATTRRMHSVHGKAEHSARMKAVALRPEGREQIQAASRKRWDAYRAANPPPPPLSEDELKCKAELKRERQRLSAIARWKRDGEVEKHKAIVWTPERRAAQAAALAERREKMNASVSAEGRARQAEAMRRIWAERKAATQ